MFTGFPDYILNPQELDKIYKDLSIEPNEYFRNNIEVNFYALKKNIEKLYEPVNRTRWGKFLIFRTTHFIESKIQYTIIF